MSLGQTLVFAAQGFAGDYGGGATPVPIPNTVVKPACAHGTAWETAWESRSLPALCWPPEMTLEDGSREAFFVLRLAGSGGRCGRAVGGAGWIG